ncbi:Hypothetical protein CINCED_3A000478 [Cinara cedri]|uniref:Cytokine-like nuclear factor N-PAC n=1 Tax=Cinara cedri TaxID=506608 RepID=A0A5E4MQV6_9HEMI|nr:Hypothetical protein CINCED_3A000478 [Cinara cedri]
MKKQMDSEWKYEIDDLVWAKMKGFPPWPGRVTEPTDLLRRFLRKNCRCIFFFGSENYAWIETGCLKPYFPFKDALTYGCKTPTFKEACRAIEEFVESRDPSYVEAQKNNGVVSETELRFETLVANETPKVSKRKSASQRRISTVSSPSGSTPKKRNNNKSQFGESSSASNSDDTNGRLKRARHNSSGDKDILTNLGLINNHLGTQRKNTLLDRPEVTMAETTPIDMSKISKSLLNKNISPSVMTFGFIGLGNMGSGIVKNLMSSGHSVVLWNRSREKCEQFEQIGATYALTPSDVVTESDIIFSCVSDPQVAKDLVFGNCGILAEIKEGKSFVEMSGIDPETSHDINEAVTEKQGRYMEAMIQGSKTEAESGNLVCMAAGNKELFDDCQSVFCAIAKNSFFLGEIGAATKMNLVLNTIKAVSIAGLAEGMALADRAGIPAKDVIDILGMTSLKCPLLLEKGTAMMDNNFQTHHALKHLQKDLSLSLNWSDMLEQPCPVSATVNEVFKHAKRLGYSDHDTSSIYVRAKF